MPITPADAVGILTGALASTGIVGVNAPQLASGIAAGVSAWVGSVVVTTVDTGTIGAGTGLAPFVVPQPLLLSSLTSSLSGVGFSGFLLPSFALGLANGLSQVLLQGLVQTTHPTVGVGTGIAKFSGTSTPFLIAGFSGAGLVGTAPVAAAVGTGLDVAVASLLIPIPIVGAPGPAPSTGVGFGFIL